MRELKCQFPESYFPRILSLQLSSNASMPWRKKSKTFGVWRTWNGQVKEGTASWCKTPGSSLNLSAPSPGDLFLLTRMFFSQRSAWLPSLPFLRVFAQMPLFSLRLLLTTLFEIGNLHLPTYSLLCPFLPVSCLLSPCILLLLCTCNCLSQQYHILNNSLLPC